MVVILSFFLTVHLSILCSKTSENPSSLFVNVARGPPHSFHLFPKSLSWRRNPRLNDLQGDFQTLSHKNCAWWDEWGQCRRESASPPDRLHGSPSESPQYNAETWCCATVNRTKRTRGDVSVMACEQMVDCDSEVIFLAAGYEPTLRIDFTMFFQFLGKMWVYTVCPA